MSGENVIELQWPDLFKTISGLKTTATNKVVIEREVIPIIFVPGIMGSRLEKADGTKAWDPDDAIFMVKNFGLLRSRPAKRKKFLVGNKFSQSYLRVISKDKKHNDGKYSAFPGSGDRGWDGISSNSYGAILKALQSRQWSEPVRHCFDFPVHARGYNWSGTNFESGKDLKDYAAQVIKQYKDKGRKCKKAILVTHSMGGLVARSACMIHNAKSKVLGVVHGVQPAMGSAAAYWRMKSGFERPEGGPTGSFWDWLKSPLKMAAHKGGGTAGALVLGKDGEEVTSLLANMPGGLELLPNKLYTANDGSAQWLRFPDTEGQEIKFPQSDPYSEIYKEKKKFYRLVEPAWIDPGKKPKKKSATRGAWNSYATCLQKAKDFHDKLKDKAHPETVQFHSEGIKCSDTIIFSRAENNWKTKAGRLWTILKKDLVGKAATAGVKAALGMTPVGWGTAASTVVMTWVKDTDWWVGRGGFRAYADGDDKVIPEDSKPPLSYVLTLERPDGSGDGTVPVSSAKALEAKVLETVPIGDDDENWFHRGHEPIYKTKTAQHIAFAAIENYCIEKIKKQAA